MKKLDFLTTKLIHTTAKCLMEIANDIRNCDDDCSDECFLLALHLRDLLYREEDYEEEEIVPVSKHTSRVKVRKIRKGGN